MILEVALVRMGTECVFDFPFSLPSLFSWQC